MCVITPTWYTGKVSQAWQHPVQKSYNIKLAFHCTLDSNGVWLHGHGNKCTQYTHNCMYHLAWTHYRTLHFSQTLYSRVSYGPQIKCNYLPNSINQSVFVMDMPCIFCEVLSDSCKINPDINRDQRQSITCCAPYDLKGWSTITRNSIIFTKHPAVTCCPLDYTYHYTTFAICFMNLLFPP